MSNPMRIYSFAAAAVVLTACGGGGGSAGSGSSVTDPPAVANQAPTISSVPSQSIAQDANSDVIAFSVSDPEATAVTMTVESSNPDLLAADGLQLSGNDGSRGLLLRPTEGAAGTSTVTLIATDAAGLSARQSFEVAVTSEQRSFREMVGTAHAQDEESEGEQIVGYSWVDNPEEDETAFDHLFAE